MYMERLKSKNLNILKKLLDKSKEEIRVDILKKYEEGGFLDKYLIKSQVRLLKIEENYVGYIWIKCSAGEMFKVIDYFLVDGISEGLDLKLFSYLENKKLIYESLDNKLSRKFVYKNKFQEQKKSILLKLDLKNKNFNLKVDRNISVLEFRRFLDEKNRCNIQNDIFFSEERRPLVIEDIIQELGEDYYINKFSRFIAIENLKVGYCQIINKQGNYFVVNFGICREYRNRGLGKILLQNMIGVAKSEGLKEIFIRVEEDNKIAKKMYLDLGFKVLGEYITWIK